LICIGHQPLTVLRVIGLIVIIGGLKTFPMEIRQLMQEIEMPLQIIMVVDNNFVSAPAGSFRGSAE